MDIPRPQPSPGMASTTSPQCTPQTPAAEHSQDLMNSHCLRAAGKHLSARDIVPINTLVERYYGSDEESQKRWRCALEKIPWDNHQGQFALWQETHLHDEGVRKWLNSNPLRPRALFRYLSSYSKKIPSLYPRRGPDDDTIFCMTPMPDGRLATGSCNGDITIWDLARQTEQPCLTRLLKGHSDVVYSIRTLESGLLASVSWDKSLKIWSLEKLAGQECITTLSENSHLLDIIVLSDHRLVSVSMDDTLTTWDLTNPLEPQCTSLMQMNVRVLCTDILPNGYVICGCMDNTLEILDLSRPTGQDSITTLEGHTGPVRSVISLPDGTIASGSDDKKMKIWNPDLPPGKRCIRTLDHTGTIFGLAMLPDGRLLAGIGHRDLVILDLTRTDSECTIPLQGSEFWIHSAIHLRGQVIINNEEHLKIWCLDELVDSTRTLADDS